MSERESGREREKKNSECQFVMAKGKSLREKERIAWRKRRKNEMKSKVKIKIG